ncbi:unnamed protein product, partial [Nesidiocoris tenuis]
SSHPDDEFEYPHDHIRFIGAKVVRVCTFLIRFTVRPRRRKQAKRTGPGAGGPESPAGAKAAQGGANDANHHLGAYYVPTPDSSPEGGASPSRLVDDMDDEFRHQGRHGPQQGQTGPIDDEESRVAFYGQPSTASTSADYYSRRRDDVYEPAFTRFLRTFGNRYRYFLPAHCHVAGSTSSGRKFREFRQFRQFRQFGKFGDPSADLHVERRPSQDFLLRIQFAPVCLFYAG